MVYTHILDRFLIIWTPFWFISVFESTAYLKFAKLQYVSSGFRCLVITGSLMRLYKPKLRSMTHLLSYECFLLLSKELIFYFYSQPTTLELTNTLGNHKPSRQKVDLAQHRWNTSQPDYRLHLGEKTVSFRYNMWNVSRYRCWNYHDMVMMTFQTRLKINETSPTKNQV